MTDWEGFRIYAINPNGTLKWLYFRPSHNLFSSCAIGNDGTIYVTATGGEDLSILEAVNPDGSLKWEAYVQDTCYIAPILSSDNKIYVGSNDKKLYAFDLDGNLLWTLNLQEKVTSQPLLSPDGAIYFSCSNILYAIIGCAGPANCPWPMVGQNIKRNCRQP